MRRLHHVHTPGAPVFQHQQLKYVLHPSTSFSKTRPDLVPWPSPSGRGRLAGQPEGLRVGNRDKSKGGRLGFTKKGFKELRAMSAEVQASCFAASETEPQKPKSCGCQVAKQLSAGTRLEAVWLGPLGLSVERAGGSTAESSV